MPLAFISPLHKATRQIGIRLEGVCTTLGVTSTEGHLLSYLRSYAPCSIAELHRIFGLKRSTLTSVLDRLEARSLIRRTTHPEDRRSFLVEISPRGKRVGDRLQVELNALESEIRAATSAKDVAAFLRVLDAVETATGVAVR